MRTFAEYQAAAGRTDPDHDINYYGMGAAGEAGELCDAIKKSSYHGHPVDLEKEIKEAGDTLWYLARWAAKRGVMLEDVAAANIKKLLERYPIGFSSAASIARVDEKGTPLTPARAMAAEVARVGYGPPEACEHANECPNVCPCDAHCFCKANTCEPRCRCGSARKICDAGRRNCRSCGGRR